MEIVMYTYIHTIQAQFSIPLNGFFTMYYVQYLNKEIHKKGGMALQIAMKHTERKSWPTSVPGVKQEAHTRG